MSKNLKPTQLQLHALFNYDSGHLRWKVKKGARTLGDLAGVRTDRYVLIKIDGVMYNARDLIWIYHHGALPDSGLKHKDGDRFYNVIENIVPRRDVISFM